MSAPPRSKGLVLISGGPPGSLPEPPYPPDAKAKGWRFELDLDRAKTSDTWAICPAEIRPWLLMMWAEAWLAVPCGTFSNDDAVIASRIGMPLNLFRAHRDVLMRGWVLHSDGRLYHHVITERITHLLSFRHQETKRIQEWRIQRKQALASDVTRNQHVSTPVGTGTGTGTGTGSTPLTANLPANTSGVLRLENPPPPCPVRKIVATYNELCTGCTRSQVPTAALHGHITARWRQLFIDHAATDREQAGKFFADFFIRVQASKFLTGQVKGRDGGKPFRASLRWLMLPENFAKTIEGEYDNR